MQNKVLKAKLILDLSIFSTPKWHDTAEIRDADLHLGETWQEEDILRSHIMAVDWTYLTLPLLYDTFKPPSKREVDKWLASYKSTSVLALSPILTLSPQDSSTLSIECCTSPVNSDSAGRICYDSLATTQLTMHQWTSFIWPHT